MLERALPHASAAAIAGADDAFQVRGLAALAGSCDDAVDRRSADASCQSAVFMPGSRRAGFDDEAKQFYRRRRRRLGKRFEERARWSCEKVFASLHGPGHGLLHRPQVAYE